MYGPRACYDEGKRLAESLCYYYQRNHKLDVKIIRIFNTYGPRMSDFDGRVIPNFFFNAFHKQSLQVYGDGMQTRSFQFIHDLIDMMLLLMKSELNTPINCGNPEEKTVIELGIMIRDLIDKSVNIQHMPAVEDDPKSRKPHITMAQSVLGWFPKISLQAGLEMTRNYYYNLYNSK